MSTTIVTLGASVPFPIEHADLQWEARQVIRDCRGVPHLFLRLRLKGAFFLRRDGVPFVRVGRRNAVYVEVAADEESVCAYFDRPPDDDAPVDLGYGRETRHRCRRRFTAMEVASLDRRLVPPGTRNAEHFGAHDPAPVPRRSVR